MMLLKFYCPNKICNKKELKIYFLKISSEEMFESGIAELFCPHCNRKLMRKIRVGEIPSKFLGTDTQKRNRAVTKHLLGGRPEQNTG
jgi:hypothetical protein